jgi:xylulokinase
MNILAADFGTSSIKGGIINERGELLEWHRVGLLERDGADTESWDPAHWTDGLRELVARLDIVPDGIALSGHGPSLVALDERDRPVFPPMLWLSSPRSLVAGQPSFYLPKVSAVRRDKASDFERVRRFFSFPEYLNYFLGGDAVTICPHDEFRPYIWDEAGLEAYEVDASLFPPQVGIGERIGSVSRKGSQESGLPAGLAIYSAGSDFLMSLLGTGTVEPGLTCDRAGTSEGINHCADRWLESKSLRTLPHVVPGFYNVAGILASSGRIFEWYRDVTGQNGTGYVDMLRRIVELPHDADVPFFFPSLHKGAVWEFAGGGFSLLEAFHGPVELGRAVVEAIAFAVRGLIEDIESLGVTVSELRGSGGQARNLPWLQMKADVTGRPISVPAIVDAELTGCAACAFAAEGYFVDHVAASRALVRIAETVEPRPVEHRVFSEKFQRYVTYRDKMAEIAKEIRP